MIEGFKRTCPFCNKVFVSTSEGIIKNNYSLHIKTCEKKQKINKIKEEAKEKINQIKR